MLVFKNNIYEPLRNNNPYVVITPNTDYNERFNPRHLIKVALHEEKEVINFIDAQPQLYWREDLLRFYPHAGRTNSLNYINQIRELLKDGLEKPSIWQHMNSYHFAFLFDVLVRFVFNYNHENDKERVGYLPELEAQSIHFESFLSNYFFDQNFTIEEEHFNTLTQKQKHDLGYHCPHLFGVINGLVPTYEEMSLKESKDYPYSIYV